jgi:AcrR family transcriptional regulator
MKRIEDARAEQLGARRTSTKAKLLAAASEVFRNLGYEAATPADVVEAAGVSRATFYLYFSNKQDLYVAVAEDVVTEVTQRFHELDEVLALGSRDRFRSWLESHADWAENHRGAQSLWHGAEAVNPIMSTGVWRDTISKCLDVMPSFVRQWPPGRKYESFARLGLFVGQLQFFHQPLLTAAERRMALDVLADCWWPQLRRES